MDHLSSCYFCGAALDERLQQYPVVPESLREGEDVPTATLCPACHQKLETVLDAVVESGTASLGATTESQGDALTATADTSVAASDTPSEDTAAPADETAGEESTLESGDEMGELAADDVAETSEADAGGGEQSAEEDDVFDDEEIPGDADETTGADEITADDEPVTADDVAALAGDIDTGILDDGEETDETDDELQSAMEPDVPEEFDTADSAKTESEPETESATEPQAEQESDTDDVTADDIDALAGDIDSSILDEEDGAGEDDEDEELQSAMEADVPTEFQTTGESTDEEPVDGGESSGTDESTAEPAEGSAETASDSEPVRTSISALEYNKVMRLLQNRTFPVDRDEIETVAANAYGLSQSECAQVIDLAVDRGLIGEDGDQLVRSE
ncbi:MAG: hypothetical protein V5A45_02415 [Haloarculaceae archaeon]